MLPSGDLEVLKPLFALPLAGTQAEVTALPRPCQGPLETVTHSALMSTIPREKAVSLGSKWQKSSKNFTLAPKLSTATCIQNMSSYQKSDIKMVPTSRYSENRARVQVKTRA